MTTSLARFGHHPDPAVDFCCEVDAIEGLAHEAGVGMADRGVIFDRASRAMSFCVGGDVWAVAAKAKLREIGDALTGGQSMGEAT